MKRFLRRTKHPVTTIQTHGLIDIHDSGPPSLGLLMLLALLMSQGRYGKFLLAFSPRLRAEILKQERELLSREPVLPQWKPNPVHLAAERKKREAGRE